MFGIRNPAGCWKPSAITAGQIFWQAATLALRVFKTIRTDRQKFDKGRSLVVSIEFSKRGTTRVSGLCRFRWTRGPRTKCSDAPGSTSTGITPVETALPPSGASSAPDPYESDWLLSLGQRLSSSLSAANDNEERGRAFEP